MVDKITMHVDFEVFKANKECFYFRLSHMFFSFVSPNVIVISENDVDMVGSISFDGNVPPFMDRFELAYAISKYGINEGIKHYAEKGLEPYEKEALELAYKAISGGAKGLDMGRNIFQSLHPTEMAKSISKIVHEKFTDKEAFEYYTDLINK